MSQQGFATIPRSLLMDPEAPPHAKLVYAALSSHAGASDEAWPKQDTMAGYLGISERQVRRCLAWLRENGFVTWETKIVGGMRSINVYTLLVTSRPTKADRTSRPADRSHSPVERHLSPVGPDTQAAQEKESLTTNDQEHSTAAEPPRADVEALCIRLADRIEDNGSKRPQVTKAWRDSCRLLIDRDGKTAEQVAKAIDWSQADEFWRANVLSMPTLRRQYDRLRLAAQRSSQGQPRDLDAERAATRTAVRRSPLGSARA